MNEGYSYAGALYSGVLAAATGAVAAYEFVQGTYPAVLGFGGVSLGFITIASIDTIAVAENRSNARNLEQIITP